MTTMFLGAANGDGLRLFVFHDHRHLDQVRRLIAGTPEAAVLVEQLIARKRTLFADDERLIGTCEVTRTIEGINVHADARDPYTLPGDPTGQM